MADVKPATGHINIRLVGKDGAEYQFKTKRKTAMGKIFAAYAKQSNIALESIKFLYDGDAVNESDTALTLGMEDGGVIEAYDHQEGGAGCVVRQ